MQISLLTLNNSDQRMEKRSILFYYFLTPTPRLEKTVRQIIWKENKVYRQIVVRP
jgi:hypothetical protein